MQPGRADGVTEGDSDSCLKTSIVNYPKSDLVEINKKETEIKQLQKGQNS